MQISKNICIFSLDSLDAANFEDFFLIKSRNEKTKLHRP